MYMYKLPILNPDGTEQNIIIRLPHTYIPKHPDNTDYQEYLAWLAEGNTPLPPDPTPEPEPLTPQQKLEAAGLTVEELRELLGL